MIYVGIKHYRTVASGTDSLEIALRALGVSARDGANAADFAIVENIT